MKAGTKLIDAVQDYVMYKLTGETNLQNNMGDFQTLHRVKVYEKYPTKKGRYEWKFYNIRYIGESYLQTCKVIN